MIAISYRREDSQATASRIHEYLELNFGSENVFIDFDGIPYGADFRSHIRKIWAKCDTVLVVIGREWAGNRGNGSRRLDDPTDFLRIEVETALAAGINVVPVLLDGVKMPSLSELPESLHDLTFRNALDLENGANFKVQIAKLIKSLGKRMEEARGADLPREAERGSSGGAMPDRSLLQPERNPASRDAQPSRTDARNAILEVESEPPGAEVVIDGGTWEVKTPAEIRRVPWGRHHYKAVLGEERTSAHFDVQDFAVPIMIDFPKAKQRIAEEKAERALWAAAEKTDSEDGYAQYLRDSRSLTHKPDAEKRCEALQEVRLRKEEAERQRREKEAARELARLKAERREQDLWAAAAETDTVESYALYLKKSALRTHKNEAEGRIQALETEQARRREEQNETKLWAKAHKADTEAGYASYLRESTLLTNKKAAESRSMELLAERLRKEEEAERRRRERAEAAARAQIKAEAKEREYWAQAVKIDAEEGYRAYLAQSVLRTNEQDANARLLKLQTERLRREAAAKAEADAREKAEEAERARQIAEQNERQLWDSASNTNTEEAYAAYLSQSVIRTNEQAASARLSALQTERLNREAAAAAAAKAEVLEQERLRRLQEDRDRHAPALAEQRASQAREHDQRTLYPKVGDTMAVDLGKGVSMEFVCCPPGSFLMGSPANERGRSSAEVRHRVTLTKGFWIGKFPVTQGHWEGVMGNNPSLFKAVGKDAPVEQVSWDDCQEFLKKFRPAVTLTCPAGLPRLPTDAEWEYACRAGTGTALNSDKELTSADGKCPNLDAVGWYDKNSGNTTHAVGQKAPNAWGIFDMNGNVCEWCDDWYRAYPGGDVTDPTGPSSGSGRVLRGGAWNYVARVCRSACRISYEPGCCRSFIGFRVVVAVR